MIGLRQVRGWLLCLAVLCSAAAAQLVIMPETTLSANGSVSVGYTGAYGDDVQSSHGLTYGGSGTVTGSFYNPNFLSFNVSPYINQSRSNSDSQSITDATGVDAGASIFSGSAFPGHVSYSRSYNKTGNYHVPGLADYVTKGNGQSFSVAWSEVMHSLPRVTLGYTRGSSDYSLYGTQEDGNSHYNNFFLNSQYRIDGFNISGGLSILKNDSKVPQLFTGETAGTTRADDHSYFITASHLLPLKGSASVSFNRNDLNSDYLGYSFNGTIDTVSATGGFYIKQNWNVSLAANYSDNLYGQLFQTAIPSNGGPGPAVGGTTEEIISSQSSHSFDVNANTTYSFPHDLVLSGQFSRRQQLYGGVNYASESFGGGGQYTHSVMGGFLNATLFLTDTRVSYANLNSLGLNANGNYTRRAGAWNFSVGGNYAQNVQTLLITYTTSSYSFTGNVGRRFGRLVWSSSASFGHSGLTDLPHTSYLSRSFSSGLGYRGYSIQGSYTKSSGNGLATGSTPLPPVIPPELLIFYGGTSYTGTFSGALRSGLTFSSTYLKSHSDTTSNLVFSSNRLEEELVQVRYQVRKLAITGGYSRVVQGFSATGQAPITSSSFSASISRWFNFF